MLVRFTNIRSEKGSVATEFAICCPVLLMIVFTIMEFGGAWYQQNMLVNASREGARLGSLYDDVSPEEVENHVINILNQSGFSKDTSVEITGTYSVSGGQVRVEVSASYDFPVLGSLVSDLAGSIMLSSVTVMRHE